MNNIIQFPDRGDRQWRDFERQFKEIAFPAMGTRADEEDALLARLAVHWTWVRGQTAFTLQLPPLSHCSAEEEAALREAVTGYGNEMLAGWYETMRAALMQLAMVELALMRSLAGEPPPFHEVVPKPADFAKR